MVESLLSEEKVPELEFGAIYTGKIVEILERGVLLELMPGLEPMMCHTSQLSPRYRQLNINSKTKKFIFAHSGEFSIRVPLD